MSGSSIGILLTGARGRVGRAIRESAPPSWRIAPCSRAPGDGMTALREILENGLPDGVDAVVHAAWSTLPATAEQHPAAHETVDLPLLNQLLRVIRESPGKPILVFLSTGAVYGPATGRASLETDPPRPIGAYARAKLAAETALGDSGLPHAILRIGNLYGLPSDPGKPQGVIPRILRSAVQGAEFTLWGSDTVKDYLHFSDFLAALEHVVEKRMTGIWNLASGRPAALHELVEIVEMSTGGKVAAKTSTHPDWDVPDNRIDPGKFRAATGWAPRIPLEEGIAIELKKLVEGTHGSSPH